jgi:protein CsiD
MEHLDGIKIENHQASKRLKLITISKSEMYNLYKNFSSIDLADLELKPFLRFYIADQFNKVFDNRIGNLFKKILTDRNHGAFLIGFDEVDEIKIDDKFLIKFSTALTHLIGIPNFDAMTGKYYARFKIMHKDSSDSYLQKAYKILELHTDGTYIQENTEWIMMTKIFEKNAQGGESVLLHLDDWEDKHYFLNDPISKQNFTFKGSKSKNVDHAIDHPIFSTDKNKNHLISYVGHFCYPKNIQQGLFLHKLSNSLENSKNKIVFKLPIGFSLFLNNNFILHGRQSFVEHVDLDRELLRQRGKFYN